MAERSVLRVVLAVLGFSMLAAGRSASAAKPAPAPVVFVFGDSTADVGTNNFLEGSKFKANFRFNGIDFPGHMATGRFSNGLNSADFLAKFLGMKMSPPPFKSLITKSSLMKQSFVGVNFASGGCGLLDLTGESPANSTGKAEKTVKNAVSLSEQIQQFSVIRDTISKAVGSGAACKLLGKSLFFISIGSNDIFEYYHSTKSILVPKQQFIETLTCSYEKHLKDLYALGARKFGIISVPPIGCCPSQRTKNGACSDGLNDIASDFHVSVTEMMEKMSKEYEGLVYSLGNAYNMTMDVIQFPGVATNFTDVKTACCGRGPLRGQAICDPNADVCKNRGSHLFWDLFHPTEAASFIAAQTLFGGGLRYVSPINFGQLAQA